MAGYSKTPLSKKLGITDGKTVLFVSAPPGFDSALAPLPPDIRFVRGARDRFDVAVAFFDRVAKLGGRLSGLKARMQPDAGLWIAWPKKASGVATDLTEDVIRDLGLSAGLVDVKVCAIDDTWSGLKLVIRVADRPKPAKRAKKTAKRKTTARRKTAAKRKTTAKRKTAVKRKTTAKRAKKRAR